MWFSSLTLSSCVRDGARVHAVGRAQDIEFDLLCTHLLEPALTVPGQRPEEDAPRDTTHGTITQRAVHCAPQRRHAVAIEQVAGQVNRIQGFAQFWRFLEPVSGEAQGLEVLGKRGHIFQKIVGKVQVSQRRGQGVYAGNFIVSCVQVYDAIGQARQGAEIVAGTVQPL